MPSTVTARRRSRTVTTSGKTEVPAFHCYVEFNGWPAGLLSPYDGTFAAGEAANEETFIAALEQATERAKRGAQNNG